VFTEAHQSCWDAARRALGDKAGTQALIEALLLHRTLPADAVTGGKTAALTTGRFEPDLVAVEARRHLEAARTPTVTPRALPAAAQIAARPAPTLAGYDELLPAGATA
jgi:hypothetical protein